MYKPFPDEVRLMANDVEVRRWYAPQPLPEIPAEQYTIDGKTYDVLRFEDRADDTDGHLIRWIAVTPID